MQRTIGAGFGQPSSKSCSSMLHDQYRGAALCAGHEGATSFQRQTYDYARHGVTSLFAALEVATGQVTDACYPRHRHQEFLRFPQKAATACPRTELHVICDNYAAHKHADVGAWLARNPRITLHFTPAGCSWLNLVQCFFLIIEAATSERFRGSALCRISQAVSAETNVLSATSRGPGDVVAVSGGSHRCSSRARRSQSSRGPRKAMLGSKLSCWSGSRSRSGASWVSSSSTIRSSIRASGAPRQKWMP